jgi:transcription elongation factor
MKIGNIELKDVQFPEDFDRHQFIQQAKEIYKRKYKKSLEKTARGKVVAIDVESEDIFIGDSVLEAGLNARQKYPDKIFHFIRVGYAAVYSHKGYVPTNS